MDSKNIEPEINFRDILYVVLKKLWIMVLAGIVLGGALFSYFVFQKKYTSDVLDITKKINSSESDIQYQRRAQNIEGARFNYEMIELTNHLIEQEREYISDSLFMQIDPENVYQSTAQIYLSVEDNHINGIENVLVGAYSREIKSGNYLNDYAESIGTKPEYIQELISFETPTYSSSIFDSERKIDTAGSIYISVTGPSRELVVEIMTLAVSEVQRVYDDLNRNVAEHSISVVAIQQIVKPSSNVRDLQISHLNRVQSLMGQISSYNSSLDSLAKALGVADGKYIINYFNSHPKISFDGIPTEVSQKEISVSAMVKPNLKYIGIGFGAGAVFLAIIVVLVYIFGKKFSTQTKFFDIFPNIIKIGVMKPVGKRSKYCVLIDIKTEDDTKLSKDNNLKLISANYNNLTKDLGKILITGTGDAKVMSEAVKALKLNGDFRPDLFNNPDVLADVTKYDGIVLLEQRNCSLISSVKNEIRLITNGGTKIIGAIIL